MSDPKAENPAAFPWQESHDGVWGHPGMTLRDYFAGQALMGMLAQGEVGYDDGAKAASVAYAYAECMLAERERRSK